MIGRLEGVLLEKRPEGLVLDVRGVGYEVQVPLSTYLELPDCGKTLALRVHTYVKEDVLALFGFGSELDRALFRRLLGVSGVGPRIGLALLSGMPGPRLCEAIRAADLAALRSVPGVGTKTAERILIELRDRIDALLDASGAPLTEALEDETLSALTNLGYPRGQAEKAVRQAREAAGPEASLEDLVREALRAAAR